MSGCPKPPRVLLTDVRMPVVGGPEVSAALTRRIPGLRTIYMSGYSGAEMESNGGLPRGSHFLQKPFTAEEFAAKLREVVEA